MGNTTQTMPLKNYGLTFIPQSIAMQPSLQTNSQAYLTQLMPTQFEVQAYGLKSKTTHLNENNIKQRVYKKPQYITLLTYNVWFQGHNMENRYPVIIKMLADSKADIICLQEVNSQFLNLLHQSAKLFTQGQDYFMPIMKMHWYDTLILSKYPCKFYKKEFEHSGMGRCNLASIIQFEQQNNKETFKLGINCVHLQSLNSAAHRINQLKEIDELNKNLTMSVIAGDFNFSDGWEEDKAIKSYKDVWKLGKRHFSVWANEEMKEVGYTMPPSPKFPPWRPDHIIYRSKNEIQKQSQNQIAIIGDFSIPPFEQDHFTKLSVDNAVRTPSDHFGLISKIYVI